MPQSRAICQRAAIRRVGEEPSASARKTTRLPGTCRRLLIVPLRAISGKHKVGAVEGRKGVAIAASAWRRRSDSCSERTPAHDPPNVGSVDLAFYGAGTAVRFAGTIWG